MTSRSERVKAMVAKTEAGEQSPAVPASNPVEDMTAALATTDRAPVDAGGAVEALAEFTLTPPPPDAPANSSAAPERPRRGRPPGSGKVKTADPSPRVAPTGRRSMRDRLADAESEAAALRAQVAQLRPDAEVVAQTREALEGTFTIAGALLGGYVHPTLDITKHAKKLAELWAVPLSPYMGDIADQMPWIAAGLGTVVVLLPVYKDYTEAVARERGELPPAQPEAVGVPRGVTPPEMNAAGKAMVEVHSVQPRPMGMGGGQ